MGLGVRGSVEAVRAIPYLATAYPRSKGDLLATFVERGVQWLHPGGMLGAISSRTPCS
jgi:hypothetical protein